MSWAFFLELLDVSCVCDWLSTSCSDPDSLASTGAKLTPPQNYYLPEDEKAGRILTAIDTEGWLQEAQQC